MDSHFFPAYRVKLTLFGAARGMENSSKLCRQTRAAGFYVGKKEAQYFDKKIGDFVADWVNSYLLDILWDWIEEKTDGKFIWVAP